MSQKAENKKRLHYEATQRDLQKRFYNNEKTKVISKQRKVK